MKTPAHLIQKKRDGKELSSEEIRDFIRGLTSNEVTDYQATAFLMAVYFRGMTLSETVALTQAMLESGERYDLRKITGPKIDKHSTGGVGDKVSLILAPLAAACGLKVPMMSGRGLGHSGGTLDKLESISGFNVNITFEKFTKVLSEVGCAMIGQSSSIAPADKKLYALRDVTATVECVPLIVASILSKKLAEGTEGLVLDVKVGSGAFMKNVKDARILAKTLTQVARKMGLNCRAVLTDMNQPLGYAVGNGLEVIESIEILRGLKPRNSDWDSSDLIRLTLELNGHMLQLSKVTKSFSAAIKLSEQKLKDGSAYEVFKKLVLAQGGSVDQIENLSALPQSRRVVLWRSLKSGFVQSMQTENLGKILVEMGGGRKKASDSVDPSTGILFHKKIGASVKKGEVLATVYAPEVSSPKDRLQDLETLFYESVKIGSQKAKAPKLIVENF